MVNLSKLGIMIKWNGSKIMLTAFLTVFSLFIILSLIVLSIMFVRAYIELYMINKFLVELNTRKI